MKQLEEIKKRAAGASQGCVIYVEICKEVIEEDIPKLVEALELAMQELEYVEAGDYVEYDCGCPNAANKTLKQINKILDD